MRVAPSPAIVAPSLRSARPAPVALDPPQQAVHGAVAHAELVEMGDRAGEVVVGAAEPARRGGQGVHHALDRHRAGIALVRPVDGEGDRRARRGAPAARAASAAGRRRRTSHGATGCASPPRPPRAPGAGRRRCTTLRTSGPVPFPGLSGLPRPSGVHRQKLRWKPWTVANCALGDPHRRVPHQRPVAEHPHAATAPPAGEQRSAAGLALGFAQRRSGPSAPPPAAPARPCAPRSDARGGSRRPPAYPRIGGCGRPPSPLEVVAAVATHSARKIEESGEELASRADRGPRPATAAPSGGAAAVAGELAPAHRQMVAGRAAPLAGGVELEVALEQRHGLGERVVAVVELGEIEQGVREIGVDGERLARGSSGRGRGRPSASARSARLYQASP